MNISVKKFFLILAFALLLTGAFVIYKAMSFASVYNAEYKQLLNHSPDIDYTIPPLGEGHTRTPLKIDANGFKWPNINSHWHTGFLKIEIAASFAGSYISPSVNLSIKDFDIIQDFDKGANGVRYINISALASADLRANDLIRLTPNHLSFSQQKAELILFSNSEPAASETFLFLSPHPDDAEIAASGLYQQYNKNSWVVTITAGEGGGSPLRNLFKNKSEQYQKKGMLRSYDSATIPRIAGIQPSRIVNLGYFDGTLKKMYQEQPHSVSSTRLPYNSTQVFSWNAPIKASYEANWSNLVSDLTEIIKKASPDNIITPHPLLDEHSDHQFTTIALLEALEQLAIKNINLYTYSNHVGTELYPFGNRDSEISIPYIKHEISLFDSIYSYALSSQQLAIKLLSIDLMHDLKHIPSLEAESLKDLIKNTKGNIYSHLTSPDKTYYRRSIRPNELFYLIRGHSKLQPQSFLDCLNELDRGHSMCAKREP